MEKILECFENPGWWTTVFFVGIVINLISYYLLKLFSAVLSKFSKKYAQNRVKRNKNIESESEELSRNEILLLRADNQFYFYFGLQIFAGVVLSGIFCFHSGMMMTQYKAGTEIEASDWFILTGSGLSCLYILISMFKGFDKKLIINRAFEKYKASKHAST